jgi:hypothetical protein
MGRHLWAGLVRWTPQAGPQTQFVRSEAFEVIYGGARGGGKTDAVLGEFAIHAHNHGPHARGLLVRRTRVALEPTIARAKEIYRASGAAWRDAKSRFEWPNGAVLYFRHLDNDADADLYQGHSYTRLYVEELTQFPNPGPVDKLKATLRSAAGVRCAFRATCNPGGAGHNWVKARYIDAGAHRIIKESFRNPFDGAEVEIDRLFIPARLSDNPRLLANDPGYVARLQQSGSAELVRAWLEGDWNIAEGAFFDRWSNDNIIVPFVLPDWWTRYRAFDWGSAAPFSVGWWTVASDDYNHPAGIRIPRGALIRYAEWYGRGRRVNEGLRLTAEEVGAGIVERERLRGDRVTDGVADPSIFARNGGPSIAERMNQQGAWFRPADNTRVGRAGAMSGWDQVRARMRPKAGAPPMLHVFDTCREFIRTVPVLQHDPMRIEDIDTAAEDHIADETRYACLARPLITEKPKADPARSMVESGNWTGWDDSWAASGSERWKTL